MKRFLSSIAILTVAALVHADDTKKVNDSGAPDELLGSYKLVAGERYGEKIQPERVEGVTVRIAKDGIVVVDKDQKEVYAQTYTLDTATRPWKIVMTSKITPFSKGKEEQVAKGLIEKTGDTVRLIYAIPGGETPTEFKTTEKQLMFEMKAMSK